MRKTKYIEDSTFSKGNGKVIPDTRKKIFIPTPGCDITVLEGSMIPFSWQSDDLSKLVFKDDGGRQISGFPIDGLRSVTVDTSKLGYPLSKIHSWNFIFNDGKESSPCTIRLLSKEYAEQVKTDLETIDATTDSDLDKQKKKAIYLLTLSEVFSKDVNLYWFSYYYIKGLDVNTDADAFMITDRLMEHLK
ncbi:MAG: hypothetical protein HQK89_05000 [Nitrospirae bacterium]|nr:hypothetical protein [Nitrospirota bacterium]